MKAKDEKFPKSAEAKGKTRKKSYKSKKPASEKGRYYLNDRVSDTNSRVCAGSQDNDPAWYSLNPQLLKDAASFPYAWPLGNKLNVGKRGTLINQGSLPGILVMNWVPTIGYSSDGTSPVNVASINTYTKVRHDNSGHANYDHADYMMYLLAMDSVYAFHSWMRRVYGCMLTYSNTNRYYPRAIVQAMGVDFDKLQGQLADFRQYINTYAIKASALAVPAKMSFMTKHYWMSEGLYYDSQQDKPQTYLFNPLGFYRFELTAGEAPHGKLHFVPMFYKGDDEQAAEAGCLDEVKWDLRDIISYGDSLLAPIISDEDFGIMSGDTLKSFGIGGCYTLPVTEETYTVVPSYSSEVLDQIQNATFIGMPARGTLDIDQNVEVGGGWIIADPKFTHPWIMVANESELPGQNAFLVNRFVTFEHGDIAPENTMEATRWTNISVEVTDIGTREYRVPTMGSEVMCTGNICYFKQTVDGRMEPKFTDPIYVSMNADAVFYSNAGINLTSGEGITASFQSILQSLNQTFAKQYLLIQQLSVFDRHPAVYLTSYLGVAGDAQYYAQNAASTSVAQLAVGDYNTINGVLFDVNYYTILDSTDLEEMSHIALLSEFDVTVR